MIDVTTVTTGPIVATTTGIDVIIAANTAAITDATIIIAVIVMMITAMTGMTTEGVIAVMTSAMSTETIGVMIDVAKTITTATTTTARSDIHHHHLKGHP
jgi:hypothetical protein